MVTLRLFSGAEYGNVAALRGVEHQPRFGRHNRGARSKGANANCTSAAFRSQPVQNRAKNRAAEWRVEIKDSPVGQIGLSCVLRKKSCASEIQFMRAMTSALHVSRLKFDSDCARLRAGRNE
jgi:hypothetical protein